ncbi:class A beta-lactamase-related serine hydrolase [bacterium]|nr:class A beta-lactamase-related serine hydrolase [bacterium]
MDSNSTRRSFIVNSTVGLTGLGYISSGMTPTDAHAAAAQKTRMKPDRKLTEKIENLIKPFRGDVGVYVHHLPSGRTAEHRADELFPTASLIKVSIMLALFDRMNRGELSFHQVLEYDGTYTYKGMNEDILACFKIGEKIRLSKLIMLMITISDNSASIWCQELAGSGMNINRVLEENGFGSLRINARTPGREDAYEQYGWGQTSPRELCDLFVRIRRNDIISPSACEAMYRILTRIYWNGEALSQIPPYVQAASKQGALNRSRSEVVLVNAPSGDYVFCVITKNQEDQSWEETNEGFVLLRDISRLLWRHFEPDYGWEPAPPVDVLNR